MDTGYRCRIFSFPSAGLRPDSSESRRRGCGCEMAFCHHMLGALKAPNGNTERSGQGRGPGEVPSVSSRPSAAAMPADGGGRGQAPQVGALGLAASCAQHLLKS